MTRRERKVGDLRIWVDDAGELHVGSETITEQYRGQPISNDLMNELEMRARRGEFECIRDNELLTFLKHG